MDETTSVVWKVTKSDATQLADFFCDANIIDLTMIMHYLYHPMKLDTFFKRILVLFVVGFAGLAVAYFAAIGKSGSA